MCLAELSLNLFVTGGVAVGMYVELQTRGALPLARGDIPLARGAFPVAR